MKKLYISALIIFIGLNGAAQTIFDQEKYKEVLYRVNAGGEPVSSHDNTDFDWLNDNFNTPSDYSNHSETGNKILETEDEITLHSSVPEGIPVEVFKVERSILDWEVDSLNWDFPVETGKQVEVRIYMAEIFFTTPENRTFDIALEGEVVESDLNLIEEYGHDVGIMKSYTITSDGNIDIAFIQKDGQPTVGGIEIIELQNITSVTSKKETFQKAFPNPFTESLTIPVQSADQDFYITDLSGKVLLTSDDGYLTSKGILLNSEFLPKGIYLVKFKNQVQIIEKQ